jgi:hypothetical protein
MQPYVTATDTYVKDTDDFTRRLAGIRVPTSTFLVTYDVERLYPSIPHDSCLFEVERHLRERGCRLSAFAVTILGLILSCTAICTCCPRTCEAILCWPIDRLLNSAANLLRIVSLARNVLLTLLRRRCRDFD